MATYFRRDVDLVQGSEDEIIAAAMQIISTAVAEANQSLAFTIAKLDRLHMQLAKSNPSDR